jgi:intracellular multiplication protein IcmD
MVITAMIVAASNVSGAQSALTGPAGGSSEEQTLLQAAGPTGPQFLSQVQTLARSLGIPITNEAFDPNSIGAAANRSLRGDVSELAKLITAGSFVAGFALALAAVAKFKAHKDNPTEASIVTPIALLFIAVTLTFLPSVLKSIGGTIFGDSTEAAGADVLMDITPVLQEAKVQGLTRESARGSLLPADAKSRITAAVQSRGLTGSGLDFVVALEQLTAETIVAAARA